MPCRSDQIDINLSGASGPTIPGFGIPISPFQIPLPNLDLPLDLLESFTDLINRLGLLLPSGLLKPNASFPMKTIFDYVSVLLGHLAPFLSIYNFFIAALRIIVCIIEVLCSIPNPFAVMQKLKILFSECIPNFLAIFPFFALIAIILSFLLLLLALITYIIETILAIIEELLKNLAVFQDALTLQDATSTLAAVQKIASLLCFIENLLSIFIAIAAIIEIIKSLAKLAGFSICSSEDETSCCAEEICPLWLRNNKEIIVTTGKLAYFREVGSDLSSLSLPGALTSILASSLKIREERWQVYDTEESEIPIALIVTPTEETEFNAPQIFYPEQEFTKETLPKRAPYVVDLEFITDPNIFDSSDILGSRTFIIKNCIVVRKPRIGVLEYNNELDSLINTGTFDLEGGLVFESDGITTYEIDGEQATLNTFIHFNSTTSIDVPFVDDGYYIEDVTFTWKPNHPALAGFNLITVGCIPEVSIEKTAQNAIIQAEGIQDIASKLPNIDADGFLPDVVGAQQCVQLALDTLRTDINYESVGEFKATVQACLENLQDQTAQAYCGALIAGVSQFKSTFAVDPNAQFTTRTVKVSVFLRDPSGTLISTGVPDSCIPTVIDKLKAELTFGDIGEFTYDSETSSFIAEISSDDSGEGILKIIFDNKVFSTVTPGTGFTVPTVITETEVEYAFVDAVTEPAVRRNESDVAGE